MTEESAAKALPSVQVFDILVMMPSGKSDVPGLQPLIMKGIARYGDSRMNLYLRFRYTPKITRIVALCRAFVPGIPIIGDPRQYLAIWRQLTGRVFQIRAIPSTIAGR